jgi:hypothetical protein
MVAAKKFLPGTHDSLITGYTAQQVKWIEAEEGNIWGYINQNEKPVFRGAGGYSNVYWPGAFYAKPCHRQRRVISVPG